jgi:NADPH:quinone reductase-like Zn-dependent oxidoreductase
MRAFALESLGEPGSVRDLPDREPKDGEVLVRIRAAGVNVFDAWVVLGAMKDAMEHRFPLVPGVEASGVVEATGAGVTAFTPGGVVLSASSSADPELLAQRGLRGGNINRASPERLPELTRLVDEKHLQAPSIQVFDLEKAGDALAQIQGRHVRGKLAIAVT